MTAAALARKICKETGTGRETRGLEHHISNCRLKNNFPRRIVKTSLYKPEEEKCMMEAIKDNPKDWYMNIAKDLIKKGKISKDRSLYSVVKKMYRLADENGISRNITISRVNPEPLYKIAVEDREFKKESEIFNDILPDHESEYLFDDLPEGDGIDRKPFILNGKKILVLSDIQIPYHDKTALKIALMNGLKNNVDVILLNGDILDMYALSNFDRTPSKRILKEELDIAKFIIKKIRESFPKARIIWKDGNHESRMQRYIDRTAPELFGIESITIPELLDLKKFNIEYIDGRTTIQCGKLNIIHGHEYRGGVNTINIARNMLLKTGDNILFGHWHRTDSHTSKRVNGEIIGAYATGCLCNLTPDWIPNNQWNHGFALLEMKENGHFRVDNKKIHKGELL